MFQLLNLCFSYSKGLVTITHLSNRVPYHIVYQAGICPKADAFDWHKYFMKLEEITTCFS